MFADVREGGQGDQVGQVPPEWAGWRDRRRPGVATVRRQPMTDGMGLDKYRQMRDFRRTPEPKGRERSSGRERVFVVQKHAARRLHYDFRLELDGVLLSWAIPKGPSLDPKTKRLAMRTEDHPIAYGDFAGVIPKGEYGGGTVLAGDRGSWTSLGDPRAGMRKGHLRFTLDGTKLQGEWHLVRTAPDKQGKERWLLFKADDEAADPEREVVADASSVLTGRTMEEVAERADSVSERSSERGTGENEGPLPFEAPKLKKAKKAPIPHSLLPELATLTEEAPEGEEWVHEIKYDGYRALIRIDGGEVRALSRRGLDWSEKFRPVCAAATNLPVRSAWIDGEVVVQREDGRTDFQLLQNDLGAGRTDRLAFYAFDLPYLDGQDLRAVPLAERKAVLEQLLDVAASGPIRYSRHVVGRGGKLRGRPVRLGQDL
ncbi:MAG: DNA polymerase ligase N-terminal domain-containing protein [Myxococcota bacterium]